MGNVDFRDGRLYGKFGNIVGSRTLGGMHVRGFTPRGVGASTAQVTVNESVRTLGALSRTMSYFEDARDFYSMLNGRSLMAELTGFNVGNMANVSIDPADVQYCKGKRCPFVGTPTLLTIAVDNVRWHITYAPWFKDSLNLTVLAMAFDRVTGYCIGALSQHPVAGEIMVNFRWFPPASVYLVCVGLDTDGRPMSEYASVANCLDSVYWTAAGTWYDQLHTLGGMYDFYSSMTKEAAQQRIYVDSISWGGIAPIDWDGPGFGVDEYPYVEWEDPTITYSGGTWHVHQPIPDDFLLVSGNWSRLKGSVLFVTDYGNYRKPIVLGVGVEEFNQTVQHEPSEWHYSIVDRDVGGIPRYGWCPSLA